MKKNYKDFKKIRLGGSDIACLICVGMRKKPYNELEVSSLNIDELKFGEDGSYEAYFIDEDNIEIPQHYKLKYSCRSWIKIYDDEKVVFEYDRKKPFIDIYRAGEFGCIIHVHS